MKFTFSNETEKKQVLTTLAAIHFIRGEFNKLNSSRKEKHSFKIELSVNLTPRKIGTHDKVFAFRSYHTPTGSNFKGKLLETSLDDKTKKLIDKKIKDRASAACSSFITLFPVKGVDNHEAYEELEKLHIKLEAEARKILSKFKKKVLKEVVEFTSNVDITSTFNDTAFLQAVNNFNTSARYNFYYYNTSSIEINIKNRKRYPDPLFIEEQARTIVSEFVHNKAGHNANALTSQFINVMTDHYKWCVEHPALPNSFAIIGYLYKLYVAGEFAEKESKK